MISSIGTILEWFDFACFGYFASTFSHLFFPAEDKVASLAATFAVFAGAGTPPGQVIGETDGEGGYVVGDTYYPQDIAATIYTKLGIPLDTTHTIGDGRPMRLCHGELIPELMG